MSQAPDRGDIVWVNLDPVVGHEQSGHRPVVVISPLAYNQALGMALVCPMTTKQKGFPMEVLIAGPQTSVVLSDQLTNIDWRARGITFKGQVTAMEMKEILAKLKVLVQ